MGKPKRKKVNQDIDASLSDSSTNLSNQSESRSWECPLSARKHFNSGSQMISTRRASLRSAKRLTEIEKTLVLRCSRQNCSATNAFQQPDDPVDTVISAIQVQAGSVVESSPRLLKQVAPPSPFTPEMRHETEKLGNIIATENYTVNIQEMEKVHEAESNHLNQMDLQKTFLVEHSPLEKVSLAKEFQVSSTLEKRENKNHSKSTSTFGPSSSSFSFNFTEIVNMLDNEDDEVNSVGQRSSMDSVEGYQVKANFMPILRNVLSTHGDIAENSTVLTMKYRSKLLEMICEIISELQAKKFSEIKDGDLKDMIALVNEMKSIKVEIEWLHVRLVEIVEARQILKQSGMLKEKRDSKRNDIETAKKELEEFEVQKKAMEEKFQSICDKEIVCKESLARAKKESTRISEKWKEAKSEVSPFFNCSLIDDLL